MGNPLVPYGTPLHVTELFLQVLKMTFEDFPENHPLRYIENDFENSGIAFDVALNRESEIYGKKPMIIVSRGAQNASSHVLGDLAAMHMPSASRTKSNLYSASINAQILGRVKAEVEIIGQHVFNLLMFWRARLPGTLGVHSIENVILTEVNKMEEDDAMYVAQAQMSFLGQYVWRQYTIDPFFAGFNIAVEGHGDERVYKSGAFEKVKMTIAEATLRQMAEERGE